MHIKARACNAMFEELALAWLMEVPEPCSVGQGKVVTVDLWQGWLQQCY